MRIGRERERERRKLYNVFYSLIKFILEEHNDNVRG